MQDKTLLIADDHPIFRQGMKQILASIPGLKVVAEAQTGDAALSQIRFHSPDMVMLDIAMPGMDGLEVLRRASADGHTFTAIIVTSYDDSAYLEHAFDLGARAYVLKDAAATDLVDCVTTVIAGGMFISPTLGSYELKLPQAGSGSDELMAHLTKAELKVLSLVADFKTSKQIARELNVSHRTIQNHRTHICRKLDLHGVHQLMSFAREHHSVIARLSGT
jgi:DNA-binding NarL/FixJ family response regulator